MDPPGASSSMLTPGMNRPYRVVEERGVRVLLTVAHIERMRTGALSWNLPK